ncbi:DUF4372 domain-containing protein [Desulfovibrio sp. ZJ369]|uniref:DUF4372 domain-containing protein n=1 Tax=Desulfovibrio sp. ZJ369 TaxID=2709793 RepID=UPI001F14FFB0|nr:DUF4372 domain-containing protein [Desulfovibrio sp. ZJ369]
MSHHSTLFSQTLSLIPRHVFQKLGQRHKTGRASRKFGFKEQFTAMTFIPSCRQTFPAGRFTLSGSRLKASLSLGPEECGPLNRGRCEYHAARGLFPGFVR